MLLKERANSLGAELQKELKHFRTGSKFYGIRDILSRYHVSRRVVDLALKTLVNDGLLEHRSQYGYYVRNFHRRRKIIFYHNQWVNEELREISLYLQEEFKLLADYYEIGAFSYDYRSNLITLLEQSPADVLVVCPPARPLTREEIVYAAESPRPIIFMDRNLTDASLHCTFRKFEYGIMELVEYLVGLGHRNLGLLVAEPLVGGNRIEMDAFPEFARHRGCHVTVLPCNAEAGNYSPTLAHDVLSNYLENHKPDFTALFVISDYAAQGAIRALTAYGYRVPEDISVVGSGSALCANYTEPPLTTLGVDLHESISRLAREIHRMWERFDSGERLAVFSVPRVTERASTRRRRLQVPAKLNVLQEQHTYRSNFQPKERN